MLSTQQVHASGLQRDDLEAVRTYFPGAVRVRARPEDLKEPFVEVLRKHKFAVDQTLLAMSCCVDEASP